MPTEVKICGLRTQAALDAALAGGADYVGLVFFPPSPRNVAPAAAKALADTARGRAKIVALMVDADDALIDTIMATAAPDLLQLHGEETPERAADIRRRWGKPVMKAIKVETAQDARAALGYREAADLILFDARAPADSTRPGGNGAPFDWRTLLGVKDQVPFMLSGGLTPDNVAEAIRATGAAIVDVSSGVESSPGEKDPELIRRFCRVGHAAGDLGGQPRLELLSKAMHRHSDRALADIQRSSDRRARDGAAPEETRLERVEPFAFAAPLEIEPQVVQRALELTEGPVDVEQRLWRQIVKRLVARRAMACRALVRRRPDPSATPPQRALAGDRAKRSIEIMVLDARGRATRAGSEVRVYAAGTRTLVGAGIVDTGSGYCSQNVMPVHIGLPSAGRVDVEVTALTKSGRRITPLRGVAPGIRQLRIPN